MTLAMSVAFSPKRNNMIKTDNNHKVIALTGLATKDLASLLLTIGGYLAHERMGIHIAL